MLLGRSTQPCTRPAGRGRQACSSRPVTAPVGPCSSAAGPSGRSHLSVVLPPPTRHSRRLRAAAAQLDTQTSHPGLPALLPLDGTYEQEHSFAAYANWLIPGRLMVGRYPYVEPSRCRSREQGEQQLEELLKAGISTFVSLQEEVPSQDKMTLAGKDGFLPYRAAAELIQAALNGPPPMEIVEGLRNPYLDKFLPPHKKSNHQRRAQVPGDGLEAWHPRKLHFLHSPVVDLGIPTAEQMDSLLPELERRLAEGEAVLVHCWGGRGRAGTVGALLLARLYGLGADEAIERVQRSFDTRRDNERRQAIQQLGLFAWLMYTADWFSARVGAPLTPVEVTRSPETDEQHAFIRAYVERLRKGK